MALFKFPYFILFILLVLCNLSASSLLNYLPKIIHNNVLCNPAFMTYDITNYLDDLGVKTIGQPFVNTKLIPALQRHFNNLKYGKDVEPLILRFHGPTGVGKTFVADFLANCGIFKKKLFISLSKQIDSLGKDKFKEYWSKEIENVLETCKRSIFVFDDLSYSSKDILDDMPPFKRRQHIDYREAVFIYISQDNSEDIATTTSYFLKEGIHRMDIPMTAFIHRMSNKNSGIFETISMLWEKAFGKVDSKSPDDDKLYIPFLPMDSETVKKCLQQEMQALGKTLKQPVVIDVLSSLGCYPEIEGEFCPTGCKLVSSKLPLSLSKHDEL